MKSFIAVLIALILGAASAAEALTPRQKERVDQLHKTGLDLLNRWKYSQAIPIFKEILSLDPEDRTAARYLTLAEQQVVEPYCKQAASAYLDGNYKKAVTIWENILMSHPGDTRVVKLIDMTNAISAVRSWESQYALAERLLKEKKYGQAVHEIEKLLAQKPSDDRAREMLNVAKRAAFDEEIKGHYEKAEAYLNQGKYDLAITEWKKVLELDSKQESASRFIAVAGRARLEAAYGEAKRSYEGGNYAASRDQYAEILAQNPTDLDVGKIIDRLSKLLTIAQKIDDAGTSWEMIRKAVSNYITINGNVKAAIVAVRYAEQLEPENKRIQAIRDFIEREHISVVRSMEPPSKNVNIIDQYLTFALNHIYEGRFDLAVQECDIVLILQPQNVLALKRLGSAYFATGNRGKANEAWGRALKLAPDDPELKQFIRKTR